MKSFPATVRVQGFSLIELLVTVTILTIIVFALYAVFNQVQKALRAGVTQVDVLEGGRATMQVIGRDIEQMVFPRWIGTNILLRRSYALNQDLVQTLDPSALPAEFRTNFFEELVFFSRSNLTWTATGYFVSSATNAYRAPGSASPLVGTLYRFSAPNLSAGFAPTIHWSSNHLVNLAAQYFQAVRGNTNFALFVTPLAHGVIHARWQAYDERGVLITNRNPLFLDLAFSALGNAPAHLELELGVLEPQTFEQFKSFPDPAFAGDFLARQAGKVHLFRQRIAIRSQP